MIEFSEPDDPAEPLAKNEVAAADFAELERRLDRLFNDGSNRSDVNRSTDTLEQPVAGYQIEGVLGRGAFGIVYLAIDQSNHQKIALKIPRPEVLIDPEKRRRFEAEAQITRSLQHEGIVKVLKADLACPTPFIASVFCNGPNLAEWLDDQVEPPTWQQCVRLVAKIADAVEFAHSQGVAHRDLKPANIILVPSDGGDESSDADSLDRYNPKITDFGLAKISDPTLTDTRSSLLIGTPCYMAPEQINGQWDGDSSHLVDIYALGVLLFELLTKRLPIEGDSYFEVLDNIRTTNPIKLRQLRPDVPIGVARICSVCLRKTAAARYDTAAALANDLRLCAEARPIRGKRWSLLRRVADWCFAPKRLETAGAFTAASQTLLTIWFYICAASLYAFGMVSWSEYTQIMLQDAMFIVLTSLPMVWFGFQTWRGNRKAAMATLALSLVVLPFTIVALVKEPFLFQAVYDDQNPYFTFVIHLIPATSLTIQSLLLCFGLYATRKRN